MAKINGKYEEINNINLLDYLTKNKYRTDRIVVDFNGNIIKKEDFEKINIKNTDKIEIVCFVGGG
ncbi:thiamine biosynthesis protein ThiS [Leptotrichia wadei]|uniref:Thiamine biosynthesis protein ThiS n=1 Tax=Leptotrichia wadei TaxID=157687 RepID=A0A510KWW7_9FUSO|nr:MULTISPECIES: sulfur carrier protein ThiS [Leptotrichia]AMD95554.1 thiamine biosynthesis protein ThiS [Leptotrichia sp. oral taxon 847]ASQ47544.1 thiamine biosynthesis protein ThiS [Leptotrichia sp. oral taxon 498]BBM43224.1 thiamine biosynthesis protein ThiS [Leptotrichia wadei]BBM55281.1 thiamine biosynthesis protein ThiS [Leptotrichia wadei]